MLKGPIALGTIRTVSVLGVRLIVQAATLLLLASALAPQGFGLYAGLGALAVLLGMLANFGTHLTLLRDVSRSSLAADEALRLALGTTALCGSILLLVYIAFSQVLLQIPDNMFWVVLSLGGAEVLLQPFLVIGAMELHGRGRIALSQVLLLQPLVLRFFIVLAVAQNAPENPLNWYALGHLAAVVVPVCVTIFLAPIIWRQPFRWRVARPSEWGGLAGYAVMNASANGVAELDKMLAARLLSLGAAGVYAAASRVVGSLVLPVMAMMLSAMPRLFRDRTTASRSLRHWLFVSACLYGLLAAGALLLVAPSVEALLGASYKGIGEIIRLLAFAVPAICLRVAATNILTTLERPWLRVSLELLGWLIIVSLALLFVRTHGGKGLAISIIIAEWLLAFGSVALISRISASSAKSLEGGRPHD